MSRHGSPRRAYLKDLVGVLRSSRAAIRREQPVLALHLLTTAAFEVGVARNRFGSTAATEALRRSVGRMEQVVVEAFAPCPDSDGIPEKVDGDETSVQTVETRTLSDAELLALLDEMAPSAEAA